MRRSAQADVGVDVECIDRDVEMVNIASRFFAPAEAAQLAQLDTHQQRERFFDLWTLKEALSKALGVGVAHSLASLTFTLDTKGEIKLDAPNIETNLWEFGLFAPGPKHRLAVAIRRAASAPPASSSSNL